MIKPLLALLASTALAVPPLPAQQPPQPQGEIRTLPGGARWTAAMPARWNGTLLLWSRGYSGSVGTPDPAPPAVRAALLEAGYAIAASDYGSGGWALAEAVPAQTATVGAFAAAHGKPRRVIGLGYSMGGLVTTALAEQRRPAIDAGVAMCASIGGTMGMMNMALDGAAAFRTLAAPDAGIALVDIADDRANGARVGQALAAAMRTPEGRARVALAAVLAGIPGWTDRADPQPAADDAEAQVAQMAKAFVMGVFLPRADQEKRAGGVFSWTTGVSAQRQLALSGRRALVEALYARAGLTLDADLARLDAAPRIAANPQAVRYMTAHYTPNARPTVPLLAVQTTGDGLTSPSLQRFYTDSAPPRMAHGLWLAQAGHCTFTPEQVLASVRHVEARLDSGRWPARPAGFVDHRPPPLLRPCLRGGACR